MIECQDVYEIEYEKTRINAFGTSQILNILTSMMGSAFIKRDL